MGRTDDLRVVDPHETALVSGYRDPEFFGIKEIFPIVQVGKERGSYTEYGPDASVIVQGLEQPLGKGRKAVDMTIAKGDFAAVKQGVKVPYYDEERNQTADPETLGDKKATLGMKVIQASMEYTVAQYLQNAASYAVGNSEIVASDARWDNYASATSNPVADLVRIGGFMETIFGCDLSQISFAVGPLVARAARLHPKVMVTSPQGHQEPAKLTDLASKVGCAAVNQLLGMFAAQVDRKDPRNTIFAHIWGKVVIAYRKIEAPSMDEPLWGGVVREKGFPEVIVTRDDDVDADYHHVKDKWGLHVRSNKRGYLMTSVVS